MSATPTTPATALADLYEADETAWLEAMSELAACRRVGEMDFPHLSEYLSDMAKRDRREVKSRLVVLLIHMLKWEHQPDKRTGSWQATLLLQRRELADLLDSRTLRNHADATLADAYQNARRVAAVETGLPAQTFPEACPFTVEQLVGDR
ncbi:MAG TPA: DUF29 domain-containing protein [Fimbriiglobus sp.]|nr:DUF29 domain-containing protein [Fimbriiglobus sp.]